MARIRLKEGARRRDLGNAMHRLANSFRRSGGASDPGLEQVIRDMFVQPEGGLDVVFHYDGIDKTTGRLTVHLVIPDLSSKARGEGDPDLNDMADEFTGTVALAGCAG